ncbi:MAG TPA: hypothetical protein H9894_04665 [Candidatus Desulfovibrio intestinipullorum]|uniref:Dynamin family protein n=1 Tax=Candidatus Desulfovibrio intestinipullorum TaxID=2838536 RepID=A0A9D1PXQ8_9BACT|nr:hypothetical protein [Candidatus Desulfovibrio intestinipullorum]
MKSFFETVRDTVESLGKEFSRTPELGDAGMAIRIIGEYSAGKTRLVRELLGNLAPAALLPISSQEVQTRLPLEVTYGETPSLQLVRRVYDTEEAQVLRELDVFPQRQDVASEDPGEIRLRLAVPEPRLTLAEGDGLYEDDTQPKRLFLIDMPGWNSEDDTSGADGLELSEDWENLAIVYVSHVTRLDSALNLRQFKHFLHALLDGELLRARDRLPLFFLITACPAEERAAVEKKQLERIQALLHDNDKFIVRVMAVDFASMSTKELAYFRKVFWDHVLLESPSPALEQNSVAKRIENWPTAYALRPYLARCLAHIACLDALFARVCANGLYMGGRSMRFFAGLDTPGLVSRAKALWYKQLEIPKGLEAITSLVLPTLPDEHPLAPWLEAYWYPRLRLFHEHMLAFFTLADQTLSLLTPDIDDLEAWLAESLDASRRAAGEALPASFRRMCEVIANMPENMPEMQRMATVVTLSLLEARYDDSYQGWHWFLSTVTKKNRETESTL